MFLDPMTVIYGSLSSIVWYNLEAAEHEIGEYTWAFSSADSWFKATEVYNQSVRYTLYSIRVYVQVRDGCLAMRSSG